MTKADPLNRTRLMYACADEEVSTARLIVAEGDDVNARDTNNWTAMHFAAQLDNVATAVELMTMLLQAGAEIDPQQTHGNTPLHRATYAAREDGRGIQLLLKHGADRHKANNVGVTPFNLAQNVGNFDLLRFF